MATDTAPKTIGTLNREFFDTHADSVFNETWVRDLLSQISSFLKENVAWVTSKTDALTVLDYACGAGIVSTSLAPFASTLRGIDISGGMVKQYNLAAAQLGLSSTQMRAVRGDLLEEEHLLDDQDLFGFDVAGISMALHHVEHPASMVKKLAGRLAPGGSLVVIDWLAHESLHGRAAQHASHTVTRSGFEMEEMQAMFADAGLLDFAFELHPEKSTIPGGGRWQLFFARGRRPT